MSTSSPNSPGSAQASVIDVARAAGVSPSTVCRALNDKGDISKATRQHVLDVCNQLGYVRNSAASNLRLRRSNAVSCLMPDGDNELLIDKLHELKRRAIDAGLEWRLSPYRDNNERTRFLNEVIAQRPAGIVISGEFTKAEIDMITVARIPTVAYDHDVPGFDSVVLDRMTGVCEAVLHLLDSGRRRIMLLGAALDSERGRGYQQALQTRGVNLEPELVIDVEFGRDLYSYGYEQMAAALGRGARFDAFIAINDASAVGAIRALSEAKKTVPGDIAAIGFDNIMVSRYTIPSLTTIAQPVDAMAEHAIAFLVKRMKDADAPRRHIKLSTSLVIRESC